MEQLEGNFEENLKKGLQVIATDGIEDCQNFKLDFLKVLGVEGKICKGGLLSITGKIFDLPIKTQSIDISKKEFCMSQSAIVEELKICFYLDGSCLKTKGTLSGLFHSAQNWDFRIVCF